MDLSNKKEASASNILHTHTMATQYPIHIFDSATEDQHNKVKLGHLYDEEPSVCVCIQNYGAYIWSPLSELSAANWMKYRDDITTQLVQQFQTKKAEKKKLKNLQQQKKFIDESQRMIKDLYHLLSPEEKKAFIKRNRNTYMGRHTCELCLCYVDKKMKCIHHECQGMCDGCHKTIGETCPVCTKRQNIECPICQEEKSAEELATSDSCQHKVCWTCYGKAYKAHAPIDKCPLCRDIFTAVPPPTYYAEDEVLAQTLQILEEANDD